jgi:hypothetical protein
VGSGGAVGASAAGAAVDVDVDVAEVVEGRADGFDGGLGDVVDV